MLAQVQRRLFSTNEYHRLVNAGILHEKERIELIQGELILMAPIGSSHASRVDRLNRIFNKYVGERAIIRVQNPVKIDDHSEPEPDIALLKPRSDFYAERHPAPQEVFLIVEVADTSLDYDRNVKMPLYAQQGISEAWLINLPEHCVELYTEPSPQGYEVHRIFHTGKIIISSIFPDLHVPVEEILG